MTQGQAGLAIRGLYTPDPRVMLYKRTGGGGGGRVGSGIGSGGGGSGGLGGDGGNDGSGGSRATTVEISSVKAVHHRLLPLLIAHPLCSVVISFSLQEVPATHHACLWWTHL